MERISRNDYVSFLETHSKVSQKSPVVAILRSCNIFAKDGDKFIIALKYGYMQDKLQEYLNPLTLLTNEFLKTTDTKLIITMQYDDIWEQVATPDDRKERAEREELEHKEKEEQERQVEENLREQIRARTEQGYILFKSNTSVDAHNYELSNIIKIDGNTKVIHAIKEWVNEPEYKRQKTHHFLTLVGECGRGKTHLALCVVNEYLKRPNNADSWFASSGKVDYFQVANLLTLLKAGYSDNSNDIIMKRCNKADLLILDDLGMQRDTDWALEQLDMIIDNRYIKKQDTIFTTNMKLSELPKRIASRLSEGDSYVIGGEDFRIIKAKERKKK